MSNLAASIEAAPHQSSLGSDHMNKGSQQIQPSPWDPLGPLGTPWGPLGPLHPQGLAGVGAEAMLATSTRLLAALLNHRTSAEWFRAFGDEEAAPAAAEGREGGDAWNIGAGGNRLGVEN